MLILREAIHVQDRGVYKNSLFSLKFFYVKLKCSKKRVCLKYVFVYQVKQIHITDRFITFDLFFKLQFLFAFLSYNSHERMDKFSLDSLQPIGFLVDVLIKLKKFPTSVLRYLKRNSKHTRQMMNHCGI